MSIEKIQRLVELDEQRADLERQLAVIVSEMQQTIGVGFAIAGAKIVPVKRGAGALKIPTASPSVLGPGSVASTAPATDGERRSAKERILEHLGGCGEAGASIPDVMHALGLRAGQVSSSMLELKAQKKLRRVSRGVYAALK